MSGPLGEQFATIIVGPWPGSRRAHERNVERICGLTGYLASGTGNPDINAAFALRYSQAEFNPDRNRMEWRLRHPSTNIAAVHTVGGITEIYDGPEQIDLVQHSSLMPPEREVADKFMSWVRSHTKKPG